MFKLESYITPIILNHVAKYVNIRPEDSQVSLWEGEVALQNLDLRLDVLEDELSLPFEFLSGHVHELSISVPWTKITSEPIKITINTIEFVLKVKDTPSETGSSSVKSEKKKPPSTEESAPPQHGYVLDLVNKIIHNISVNCHNIILKYVQDDIVVSMNIQVLSCCSADEHWKPAFVDMHPIKFFIRKLIQISDLTICLDKRNAAGQIEVCQEPILYRCSLEGRAIRKYNAHRVHLDSSTKVSFFTKLMELNISSLQVPMVLRLIKILQQQQENESISKSSSETVDEENADLEGVTHQGSILSWVWNKIPNIASTDSVYEDTDEDESTGQVIEIDFYIDTLNFTFKNSEFITDSIVGATKKIRYSPVLRLVLNGVYSESICVADNNWFGTKAGFSSIVIESLGNYFDPESERNTLLNTPRPSHNTYLNRSLFDETFIEKDWKLTNYADYSVRITNEYLIYRGPVFAFDMVEYQEQPTSEETLNDENARLRQTRKTFRILVGSITFRYNQTLYHIVTDLDNLVKSIDFAPFYEDNPESHTNPSKLHPPSLEDFDSLMAGIPLTTYHFQLSNINLEIHSLYENNLTRPSKKSQPISKNDLPFLKLVISKITCEWSTPTDPDKLVHTTCQLPDKPAELLSACYDTFDIDFKAIRVYLTTHLLTSTLLNIPSGRLIVGRLLQPSLWTTTNVPSHKLEMIINNIIVQFSKSELVSFTRILRSITDLNQVNLLQISRNISIQELNQLKIRTDFKMLHIEMINNTTATMLQGRLQNLTSRITSPGLLDRAAEERRRVFLSNNDAEPHTSWFMWNVQIPNSLKTTASKKSVLGVWIKRYDFQITEEVLEFLRFVEPEVSQPTAEATSEPTVSTARTSLTWQSSRKSLQSERLPRRMCYPEETIHVSSERDEKVREKNSSTGKEEREIFPITDIIPFIKCINVKIEISKGYLNITSNEHAGASTQITLPKILMASAPSENITKDNITEEFQRRDPKNDKDTFPWNCGVCEFTIANQVNGETQPIVRPIAASVTIAFVHKKETITVGKPDHQQSSKEDNESEKPRSNAASISTTVGEKVNTGRSSVAGSISGVGRSTSSDDNEMSNKGSEKKRSLLQDAVETIFSSRRRSQVKDVVAINLHIDTSPINVEFDSKRAGLVRDHLGLLLGCMNLMEIIPRQEPPCPENIQVVQCNEEHANIKQFLEMDSSSETSSQIAEKPLSTFSLSCLLQWTITRFTVELDGSQQYKCKLILEMEDLIASLDKREDFTKVTNKVGTMNMRFLEIKPDGDFALSDRLRIKTQTDSTQSPLFSIIYTTVCVKNFFKKIGFKDKTSNSSRNLSEIIINLDAVEVIADIDKLIVLGPAIQALTAKRPNKSQAESVSSEPAICTIKELPIVHFKSEGFTLYLPKEIKTPWCTALILKVDGIKISPNVENPLLRKPIRPDVYQKAAQVGILNTPGSTVEDRQYELTFKDISVASGNWDEILTHMKDHSNNFHTTNPAFEWNNLGRKQSPELRYLFNNFTFIVTYAPCITYGNVLICGKDIEFNCANDLVISLTTDHVALMSCIHHSVTNFINSTQNPPKRPKTRTRKKRSASNPATRRTNRTHAAKPVRSSDVLSTSTLKESDAPSEVPITDSGFSSGVKSEKQQRKAQDTNLREMPFTVSFIAGIFIIKLFYYQETVPEIAEVEHSVSVSKQLTPLATVKVSQPNFFITKTLSDATTRFSLFDLTINLLNPTPGSFESYLNEQTNSEESTVAVTTLFNTKRGEVGSSGIPSPLLVFTAVTTKSKKLMIDIKVAKPATIHITRDTFRDVTNHLILFYSAALQGCPFNQTSTKPVYRSSKINIIKNMFFNADQLNFKAELLTIKVYDGERYRLAAKVVDWKTSIKFSRKPEKVNAKGCVAGLYLQSNERIVMHPLGIKFNIDATQETWHKLPIVIGTIKCNIFNFDIAPDLVKDFADAAAHITLGFATSETLWEDFRNRHLPMSETVSRDHLEEHTLPTFRCTNSSGTKEEYYQDDLRAGAFQFVEMVTDTFLPMPYQVQIIKKNHGIICWRYPQPRKISNILVSPVPMPSTNPIRVKCRMEYFSDVHEHFLHYCDFWLSETVTKIIDLPQREITANIWRVVILQSLVSINRECFEATEEDEELRSIISIGIDDILNAANKEPDFILNPKVLVGCMRIDTVFKPKVVPKFQIRLSLNELQFNIQNVQASTGSLPAQLKKFKFTPKGIPLHFTFLRILFGKINMHLGFRDWDDIFLDADFAVSAKCLDHGYLNYVNVIDPTNLTCTLKFTEKVETHFIGDRLNIRMGPSILHSLFTGKQNWELYFKEDHNTATLIISKLIIGNRTNTTILFGQSETDERISLDPRECCKYSFQSDSFAQHLTFYLEHENVELSSLPVPIILDLPKNCNSKIQTALIGQTCLIISTKRMSATEFYILIKGQIELISMVNDALLMEIYKDDKSLITDIPIGEQERCTFLESVTCDANISLRFKLNGPRGKGQTGNIPLKSNKNYPWLVKVPTADSQKFITYWVRVITECIAEQRTNTFHPVKTLVIIWPIFELYSSMTCPVRGIESTTNQEFILQPTGNCMLLTVPATHQTEHRISFLGEFADAQTFNLTLKAIDWNKFFCFDEKVWTIEKILAEFGKGNCLKWPLNDDEELRLRREFMDNRKTSIIYKCFPSRELSCALRLEVAPWAIFINSTGQKIFIKDTKKHETTAINSNAVSMLPFIKSEFTIELAKNQESIPIVFDKNVDTSKKKCYQIADGSKIDIVILKGSQIYKYILLRRTENNRIIFMLKPKYIVGNMCTNQLSIFTFVIDQKETILKTMIENLLPRKQMSVPPTTLNDYSVGVCLDGFEDPYVNNTKRTEHANFVFFICVISDNSDISIPISLAHTFNRKCFSVRTNDTSIPYAASLLEKDGQYFLSIFEDKSPMVMISNQTDVTYLVAQTLTAENNVVTNVVPEYEGKHFDWCQIIQARSLTYYTPPTLYKNFPDIENSLCNLTLALPDEARSNKNIKWSKAISIDTVTEKFLHVPLHGDVKIVICDKHRIIRVAIYYIAQQLEFSVKDLRSRLLAPQMSPSSESFDCFDMQDHRNSRKDELLEDIKPTDSYKCHHQSPEVFAELQNPFKVRLVVFEINVSIFVDCTSADYLKKEIFALYIDNLVLDYDNIKRVLDVNMANLQIDNQLFSSGNYDFPVVLCSQELYKRDNDWSHLPPLIDICSYECVSSPMMSLKISFYEDEYKIQSVACSLSPIRAYIEDTYVNDLLEYIVDCASGNVVTRVQDNYYISLKPGEYLLPKDIVAQALYVSEPLRLKNFRIDAMNVLLSVHSCVRLYIALDHSPLEFSTYEHNHILTLPLRFGHTLGMHYLSGALFGAGWVVGSLEMLGSPSGLARSFSVGLKDFVSMPVQGLLRGPWGFLVGIAQGSASLLKNITAGTVNSVTKLAASVSRNLDRLTLDPEHIQRTEALRRSRPQGFTEGFTQGITGLGISILGAVGGIARHTLEARSPAQVVTGVGKGIVGAFTKPISGAVELLALTGQGVLHTVGFNAMPQQRAPSVPRNIAVDLSEQKIWILLLDVLSAVMARDQILFHHEVTLISEDKLYSGWVFLASSIIALVDLNRRTFLCINSTSKLEVTIDPDDPTLFSISPRLQKEDMEEASMFTTQRIMEFLRESNHTIGTDITEYALRNIFEIGRGNSKHSFYISTYWGQYLIDYLKILNLMKSIR